MLKEVAIADAQILGSFVKLATNVGDYDVEDLRTILGTFGALLHSTKTLNYATLQRLVLVFVFYTSPLQLGISDVVLLIEFVHDSASTSIDGLEEANDVEEFAQYLTTKVGADEEFTEDAIELAQKIVEDLEHRAESARFVLSESDWDSLVFEVVEKRLWINSQYIDDIELPPVVLETLKSEKALNWYNAFYKPYKYYWDNYASLTNAPIVKFHEFSQMNTKDLMFEALIAPVDVSNKGKLGISTYLKHVILPVSQYVDSSFGSLQKWMFSFKESPLHNQKIWNKVIKVLVEAEVPFASYQSVVGKYLEHTYFDAVSSSPSSIELLKSYDLIKATTLLLIPVAPKGESVSSEAIEYDSTQNYDNVNDFAQGPLKPLLTPTKNSVISLSEIIETCLTLYPINQTTLPKFLEWKNSKSSPEELKRNASKILIALTPTNAEKLLDSLNLFKNVFVEESHHKDVDMLMTDRFLINNLFDYVETFYKQGKLLSEVLYELLTKKFWDSVNLASGFDDRSGPLANATSCISLFEKLEQLSKSQREEITRLKHLMKVFSNIKNFRLLFERKPPTPQDILRRFGSLPSHDELRTELESISPMGLITTLLEQNPKLYLAFERLFKILSDFLLFLQDNSSTAYYFQRLMAACIEASLIDSNFNYAYKKSIELLDQYEDHNLNNMWMSFYQVGNYRSPDWNYDRLDSQRLEVLYRQNEVLARYLRLIDRRDMSTDNSRLIVEQWEKVNANIDLMYEQAGDNSGKSRQLQENITATANEILNDAANTTSQASEKLLNLFVSGLGWAIGANR